MQSEHNFFRLRHNRSVTGIEPVALPVATLDADRVLAFLDGLEKDRHNAITAMKEKAFARMQPMDTPFRRFRPDDRLLAFLESL